MNKKMISIILPAYNERENVIPLSKEIHEILENNQHEIIIVDDNSPDGTYQALIELNKPYILPILRTEDRGFAKSIRCGIENAKGDIIIIMDSDFNHQPQYLPFMLDSLNYYDCVSASRFLYGGKMGHRGRHLLSWLFNVFVRIMTRGKITDSLYGYFAIKTIFLKDLKFDEIFYGYGEYCIRLFYYFQKKELKVLQFPAINGERKNGEGNSKFLNVFKKYFFATIKLAMKERLKSNK